MQSKIIYIKSKIFTLQTLTTNVHLHNTKHQLQNKAPQRKNINIRLKSSQRETLISKTQKDSQRKIEYKLKINNTKHQDQNGRFATQNIYSNTKHKNITMRRNINTKSKPYIAKRSLQT